MESMSSPMAVSPKKRTLIRVKRRADEEKTLSAKRCKFVVTSRSAADHDIYHLLKTSQTVPPSLVSDTDKDNNAVKIYDFEDVFPHDKHKDIIACNGQPLEPLDNQLEDALEYLYDIYVYEEDSLDDENPNHWREYEESDEDENDEKYAYNDYPDDSEVSDDVIDYYSYRDNRRDSQTALKRGLERSYMSSDYDLSDEDVESEAIDGIDNLYLKSIKSCDYEDEENEEREEEEEREQIS
ncbi:unnamed protein product [Medioppia subpectinata]|uniref:RNA polymerase II nuclear localization protein SLC7A6OS n=1 Tax=Medioppia subpectinata TaxID=1979941 RepID=A0A7R9Q6G2_9ACAR|nr:unnamed protein product [Medioppia subpectinata]CAG2114389.1 unnamed protein product [Medioppia subpectinata]